MNHDRHVSKTVRTKWVREWVREFLKGVSALEGATEIKSYCEAQKLEFEKICQERAKNSDGWKNTAVSYMTQIRKAIESWQDTTVLDETNSYPQQTKDGVVNQHLALLYLNYSSDFHKERMAPTNTRKKNQRSHLESITNVEGYQSQIESLLESHEWRELTTGLIAATGRRPSEILKTGEFEQIGQFEVTFSGQLKTKGEEREAYSTYTLVESAKVVDGLARLRRMPEIKPLRRQTIAQIDSGKNSTLNSIVRQSFDPFISPPYGEVRLSAKNLRASYAAIAIHFFCPWQQSPGQFITERLGHASDATATSYEDYQVCDSKGKPLPRGVWVERIDEEMKTAKIANIMHVRIRMTEADRERLDDKEFLPGDDLASRMSELIRLAEIGKAVEAGEIGKVTLANTSKESPQPIENLSPEPSPSHEEMPNEKLFGSHAPNTGLEKMRRAVAAIKTYNESQYDASTQWAINTAVLKKLTNSSTRVVKGYLDSDEGRLQVTDYNLEKGFSFHHNRGRDGDVTDFIRLT